MGELGWSFSSCNWKDPFVKLHVVCTRSCELESKNESELHSWRCNADSCVRALEY